MASRRRERGSRVRNSTSAPCASSTATAWRDTQARPAPAAARRLMASVLPSSYRTLQRAQVLEQPGVGGLARARGRLAQDPGGVGQLARRGDARRPAACVGARDDDQFVLQPALHHQVGMGLRALDETDVDLHVDHRLDHLAGVADGQLHRAVGCSRFQRAMMLGQQVFADRQAGRHAQRRGGAPVANRPCSSPPGRAGRSRPGSSARPFSLSTRRRPTRSNSGASSAASSSASAALAADCERATRSAAPRVEPARAVATKTSSWRRFRRSRVSLI